MRQSTILFSIIFVVACGCGKSPSSKPAEVTSPPTPDQASSATSNEAAKPPSDQTPATSAVVDLAIYNDDTNAYTIEFEPGGPKIPQVFLVTGQSVTNANVVWTFLPEAMLDFTENVNGRDHYWVVPFAPINAQISADKKHHQVNIRIIGPLQVNASCE